MSLPLGILLSLNSNSPSHYAVSKGTLKMHKQVNRKRQKTSYLQETPRISLKRKCQWDLLPDLERKTTKFPSCISSCSEIFNSTEERSSPFSKTVSNFGAIKRSCEWDSLSSLDYNTTKRSCFESSSLETYKITEEISSPFCETTSNLTFGQITGDLRKENKSLQPLFLDANGNSNASSLPTSSDDCILTNRSSIDQQSFFSFRHVETIVEDMLKEREKEIKTEYDRILLEKLTEQHDSYVKFTYEVIQKRYNDRVSTYIS